MLPSPKLKSRPRIAGVTQEQSQAQAPVVQLQPQIQAQAQAQAKPQSQGDLGWEQHWESKRNPQSVFPSIDPNTPPTVLLAPESRVVASTVPDLNLPGLSVAQSATLIPQPQSWQQEGKKVGVRSLRVPDPNGGDGFGVAVYSSSLQNGQPSAHLGQLPNLGVEKVGFSDNPNLMPRMEAWGQIQEIQHRYGKDNVDYQHLGDHDWNAIDTAPSPNPFALRPSAAPTVPNSHPSKVSWNESLERGRYTKEGTHHFVTSTELGKAIENLQALDKNFKVNKRDHTIKVKPTYDFTDEVPLANPATSTSLTLDQLGKFADPSKARQTQTSLPPNLTPSQQQAWELLNQGVKFPAPQTVGYPQDGGWVEDLVATNPNPIVAHNLAFDAGNRRHLPADSRGVADPVIYPGLAEGNFSRKYAMGSNGVAQKAYDPSSVINPNKGKPYQPGQALVARVPDKRYIETQIPGKPSLFTLAPQTKGVWESRFDRQGKGYIPTVTGYEQSDALQDTVLLQMKDGEVIATKRSPKRTGDMLTPVGQAHMSNLVAGASQGHPQAAIDRKDALRKAKLNAVPLDGMPVYSLSGMEDLESTLEHIYLNQVRSRESGSQDITNALLNNRKRDAISGYTLASQELNYPVRISNAGFDLESTTGKYDNLGEVGALLDLDEKYKELSTTKGARSELTREQSGIADAQASLGRQLLNQELENRSSAHWSEGLPVASSGDLRSSGIQTPENTIRKSLRLDPQETSKAIGENHKRAITYLNAVEAEKKAERGALEWIGARDSDPDPSLDPRIMGPGYPEAGYTEASLEPNSATTQALSNMRDINRAANQTDSRILADLNSGSDLALNRAIGGIQMEAEAQHKIATAKKLGWQPDPLVKAAIEGGAPIGDIAREAQSFLDARPTRDLSHVVANRQQYKKAHGLVNQAFG
jgi:hypothetical protein